MKNIWNNIWIDVIFKNAGNADAENSLIKRQRTGYPRLCTAEKIKSREGMNWNT